MVRGKSFYAIWDESLGLWSTDEYDVQRLVDEELHAAGKVLEGESGKEVHVKYLGSFNTNGWSQFQKFLKNVSDNSHQLDDHLVFSNTEVKKSDYVSRRLPYPLEAGDHSAWDEMMSVLYTPEEREKIEWAIGAIVSGDAKKIQKFVVLYGPAGTGKSTVLNIVQKLFQGYYTTFEAKALAGNNNGFATEVFKSNPLVAIQHDGDLSKIEDNTKLNSIVSHEEMTMNEKFKASYTAVIWAFLLMGTNKPVKITDAKSGLIRRLIDIHPTGSTLPPKKYQTLMNQIDFELGAIAQHCLEVYREMGKNYYNGYRPIEMMLQTDVFFNFIEAHYDVFKEQGGVSLKQAYTLYKEFCADTGIEWSMPQYKLREELKNYFDGFQERVDIDGVTVRSWYSEFNASKFKAPTKNIETFSLVMDETESIFDEVMASQPAQYATERETPQMKWEKAATSLSDLDTHILHFVKMPVNHIVIDFDLKDKNGEKSAQLNLEAASLWPPTYAEYSKSGAGVHLHYDYGGDATELAREYEDGIEIKVFTGDSSLRRKLSKCNNVPVATLNSGLPFKEKKVLPSNTIQSEKGLRDLIERNLRKEIHPGTKPSVDFIKKILDDAYESGMSYDVTNMRPRIVAFANNSSNQPLQALKIVQQIKFKSDDSQPEKFIGPEDEVRKNLDQVAIQQHAHDAGFKKESPIVFYDVEVYPNLFVVCWKYQGAPTVVRMVNPTAQEIEPLFKLKLVGFNNRRYDNHIIYARFMGYSNEDLFKLSSKIVDNNANALFGEAYNLSYADIYDFSSKKQGLKKFEIELGLPHVEMDIPWDQPVPDDLIDKVVNYCCNDVEATEKVFENRKQDFIARQILADLSGLTVNDTTQKHTAKIIFGADRQPQRSFIYTDLSKEFPGYVYDMGKSTYRGELTGEGGYVYAEPGVYHNVALLDVASMHPTSIEVLNAFGSEYTKNFSSLKAARLAIKHKDYAAAKKMLDGKLTPFLQDEKDAKALSYALKIVINIVYGLTSAKFDNPFRDPRNKDNIVAKRGALFMIDLKNAVQAKGYTVAHIKTDSIKIPNADQEIIDFVFEFGKNYGYDFEHEATYEKMALVNEAVYIAKYGWAEDEEKIGTWDATGAQFAHPYVFKTLFTHEPIEFDDLCETKQVVQGAMYLDLNHDQSMALSGAVSGKDVSTSGMQFVGRTGRFVPVHKEAPGSGVLYRVKDDKLFAVTGTKGYFWIESEAAHQLEDDDLVDLRYFEELVDKAKKAIDKFSDVHAFLEDSVTKGNNTFQENVTFGDILANDITTDAIEATAVTDGKILAGSISSGKI